MGEQPTESKHARLAEIRAGLEGHPPRGAEPLRPVDAPNLLPAEVYLLKNLERSARAEVKIRLKRLRWLKAQT